MKPFLPFIVLFICNLSKAQSSRLYSSDSALITRSETGVLDLQNMPVPPGQNTSLPFNRFIVQNVSADTSFAGVRIKSILFSMDKTYEKLRLNESTSSAITNYLNNQHFTFNSAPLSLTCFMKQLRISQTELLNGSKNKMETYRRLAFEMEAYVGKAGLYYPAFRIDTTAISLAENKNDFDVLTGVLDRVVTRATLTDTSRAFKKTAYTLGELNNRYKQSADKPILKASEFNGGVYKTFNEFVNNSPSLDRYKFVSDRKTTILYTQTAQGEWLPERNVFGLCDGNEIWINVDAHFYPLVRQGNTFEFLANYYPINSSGVNNRSNIVPGGSLVGTLVASAMATAIDQAMYDSPGGRVVYQLNMETGEYY